MNPRLRIFRYIWWREKADKIFYINIYTCLYLKGGTDVKYSKKKLIKDMPGLYAVAEITLDGKVFYAAASENRNGKVYIVEATTGKATEINGGLGGVMAILDIKEENAILFIEEFYPVFDSAAAKIVKVNLAFDGENYFATIECQIPPANVYVAKQNCIELDEFLKIFKKYPDKVNIVIIDDDIFRLCKFLELDIFARPRLTALIDVEKLILIATSRNWLVV